MATQTQDTVTSAPGMPQLDFSTFSNQIFWLVLTLVVIYFVL
jgi:F-type H+-transporting ATPase subunit b